MNTRTDTTTECADKSHSSQSPCSTKLFLACAFVPAILVGVMWLINEDKQTVFVAGSLAFVSGLYFQMAIQRYFKSNHDVIGG